MMDQTGGRNQHRIVLRCCLLSEDFSMNDVRERRSTNEINKPSLRTAGLALLLVASSVFGEIAYFALATTSPGETPTVTTVGNQERQDITAANKWIEGNRDLW